MKKMISTLLSVTPILFATAGQVNTQGADKDITFIPAKNYAAYVAFITPYGGADNSASVATEDTTASISYNAVKASLKESKAKSKASKNFAIRYRKDIAGAIWLMNKDGKVASFYKDKVRTDVVYNIKGNWLHTLTYFPEDKTPQDIASTMDDAYPKDDVKLTVKVEEGSMVFYIVLLEGKTTYKRVTVHNGEVNQMEELPKGN
jgi:hypothetical protein